MFAARMYTFCNDKGRIGSGSEVSDAPRNNRARLRNDTEVFDARWAILGQQKWCHAAATAEFSTEVGVSSRRELNFFFV